MALWVADAEIFSDEVPVRARRVADGTWHVDGYGVLADRSAAITAVTLAEVEARPAKSAGDRLLIESLRAELGLS